MEDPSVAMKKQAAERAATLVQDQMVVGLGTGSTAVLLLHALSDRVRKGLRFTGVPTSESTAQLGSELGISLTTLEDQPQLDLAIDGADEVDPALNLIKGRGGALLREKIVASAATRLVIIVDSSKLVQQLGTHYPVPVEVVPFGWRSTGRLLEQLGSTITRRVANGNPFMSDGGHYVLDCAFGPLSAPTDVASAIKALTGVVEHGLFLGMATSVIIGHPDRIEVLERTTAR